MTCFFLIRHGSTDWLGAGISGWLPGVMLNAQGEREVAQLAAHLVGRVDVLYTSPLERTQQTAAPIAHALGLEPIPCEALGELRYGDWTGQQFATLHGDAAWQRFNSFRSGTRIPHGELMLEVQARAIALLVRLRDAHERQGVALVTHSDVIKTVICYFLGMPLDFHPRFEIAPASITRLEFDRDAVRLVSLNRTLGGV